MSWESTKEIFDVDLQAVDPVHSVCDSVCWHPALLLAYHMSDKANLHGTYGAGCTGNALHCTMFTSTNIQLHTSHQSVTNIFEYSSIRIFLIRIYIRIFVRIIFWIQIYSDIRSCQLFGYEYIRIFVRSKILIRIYSDLRSYQFSDSDNVFVLFLWILHFVYGYFVDNNDQKCYLNCKSTELVPV